MAKQTYTIKFGIDANDFIRELTALQSQLQNIASSMDVGLSADRVKEFSSGLNTILKNYTTAISKQDFSAMQSSLDGVYEEAIKIQKALGSDIKIDGLLSSLGRAKSTLGEFRDMTTTVSGAAISAAENIASAQQRAANQSKEASQVATVSLEQQKQKLAELQSMQQMLAGYANKRGNADKNKIKTSLVTDDLEINDSNEMHLYDVADRIKETYADLAKEMSSIDWSKAAGDPEQLQKTLSLLQQCSEMYRLIHSSDTQDILESAKFNGDQLDGSPIKTLEQAFASENEMSQKAAESLKEFSSAFEGVVDQFTKKFSTIYQSIQAQAEAQADVVKSIESGVTATNMQVQADTNAAEAAERKAQAQREAAAALSSMAGTKRVVDSNDDVINLANARQHTIKIKLSVGNPKEFLSQMQSAMADAQQIANAGIKVKAEISNDMISTVTKKYSKSGSTEQEIAINIVAKEKDNQSKVVSGVRSRLQEEAEKNPVRIPIKVEFKDAAGSIDEVKKKAEAELQKEADSIIPTTGAKATIKHKLASAEATDAVAQAKASVKNAQQMMSETLASLDAQTEKPITFAVKFNPDLAAVQQQFNDAIAAVRATAAEPVAIGTKIDDTIASLQGDASSATPIKIPVVPDAEMFKSGIATLIESASTVTPIKIPVAPDVEALLSKLSEVKASNTEVAVGFDATTATANFEALINSLAEKSNVAIKTTLDSDEMYNNFNAVVKKMRDRMSAHPIKVHIELAKSDLDNLSADDAWQNHLQSMTQLAKAEGDALDSVLGKAKELQADIEASAKQLPSLIKLLQTYQKTGGNNKQAGTANRAKSSERSAIRSTEKYTNESARVLNNIAQYENYNSPDMQAQVTAIASLNKELIQARDNLFAITRDKKSSPDDVTRAFDKFNVTLADTRGRLRDASNEAAGLNREFVATRNDAQKKISDVKSSIAQMDKYVKSLPEQKIQKFYKDYKDYTDKIRQDSKDFLTFASNPSSARSDIQSQYDNFIKYYRTIWRGVQNMSADKSYNMLNPDKAFTKGSVFADNVGSLDAFRAQVQQRLKSYKEFSGDFVNNGTQWVGTYRDASGAVKSLTLAMDQSKEVAREYSADIKQPISAVQQMGAVAQRAANYLVSSLATLVSFRMVIDYVRTGIGYVQQLDTALAQLQVVTGQSSGALKDAEAQARSIGDAIGSTTTEILNSATDWARLGYSMSDSLTLAEKSAELAKTGFMSVSTATEQMTASIQAFYGAQIGKGLISVGDAAEHVNDELVAIGNNMPITSEGLGSALERSAGSLVAAGNSLEQSVALISAANSTIQNPESVGTALKTVSMRLRGTKVSDISNEVGEDVSDDFKNAAQDVSKLYNTIKKLTAVKANDFKGVSILTDTGAYRSTFEIIKDIAGVWDQMSNVNQAALLEQIAGKRQASAIAAIFQDPDLLQKGEDYANSAAGATEKAMDTVLNTIEVRISRLQNEAQTFWQELINSNDIKKLLDGLSATLKLVNSIVTVSQSAFKGNGTAGLIGLLAGSTQSTFDKIRNGANSSGGLVSFTGHGTYVGGVKLGKNGAGAYSSVMGKDGLVYSADDIAAASQVTKVLHEASSASLSFNDALQKSGIDLVNLSDNGKHLISTMQQGTGEADELIARSKSLTNGFNTSGEALKSFGRTLLSSLASGLVMAGISVAISAITSAVDNYVHRLDTAIDKGKEFSQSIQQQSKQYSDNEEQIESLRTEYEALSRGVDEHGKNVSLTADQYKRYKEIVAQIVQLSPDVAKGYSDENGYLVDRNKLIDEAIAKQKEYNAEVQQKRFGSEGFATEINGQLATAQQAKQSSIKGQLSPYEQAMAPIVLDADSASSQEHTYDTYAQAQKEFLDKLQKAFNQSEQSDSETLDEYLQKQFGISGATVDNLTLISKSIDKITDGLQPRSSKAKSQLSSITSDLSKSAAKWVNDAETVDSVNKAVQDNFAGYVENAVDGYDALNDAQKAAIKNSISNMTYADVLKGTELGQDQSILYGKWEVDDSKRRQQQDKYADMVKLLQDSAVQRTMSNASKIDTSLNYADYEKQYKKNLKKIEKVLNSVNASEGLSLKPADIKQLITLTPVDQDGNDLHADPQAMVDRLKATLVNGENLVKDMTLDQINITYPIVQEFAEEHPGLKVDLDQAKRLVNLQVRIEELKNKSVASYSNLKTQVESYTTALSGLNDVTANNQIITTDMYNALQSAGVSIEDLNSVVRESGEVDSEGYATYLVENIDKLKEFTKVANDAAKTDISANIDAQRRRYAELVEQLDQVIGENYDYVKSNHTLTESRKDDVRSIQEQLDQTEDLLDSYAALQSQVSATANAYSAYQKAKEYDARTDFGSEAIEMVSELANDLANATYGTEAFKSAMNAIVPKSALTNMDDAIQRIKDTQKYLNSLDSQHYFKKDSDGALQGLDYETFVKNGLKSQNGIQVFTGTEGNFRLNDTITDIQQVEKAFGMTLPMVQAFDEALKRAGVTSRSMFASLSGDDSQNQIYRTLQNLNDAENQLQEAINQGVDTTPFKKKVDDAKAEIDDLANGARQRVSDYLNAMDQMNELGVRGGTEGQREALEAKLNQKPTQLDVELVDKNLDSEIETLQNGAKQKKIELYAKINHVDAGSVDSATVDEWSKKRLSRDLELKKNSSIYLDDESNAAQSEMDKLTQSLDSVKSSSGDLVKSLDNAAQAVNNLSSAVSGNSSTSVKGEGAKESTKKTAEVNVSNATANKNIKQTEDAGAKLYDVINNGFASINLKNQDALSKVASFKNAYLDAVNTVNQNPLVMQAETGIAFTKSGSGGVSKKKGKAKANGGIVDGESKALVGELGQEMVVNPHTGSYYTVGDRGAEFVDLPKDAIVFNHLQTRQLLGSGHTSRGKALAGGNAKYDYSKYSDLWSMSKADLIKLVARTYAEARAFDAKNPDFSSTTSRTRYGNVDVSNRQALVWNDKNQKKYANNNNAYDQETGKINTGYSTLLGGDLELDGYDIAFSPIVENPGQEEPTLLDTDTIYEYLESLFRSLDRQYGERKWNMNALYSADHTGIRWDVAPYSGQLIHDVIASATRWEKEGDDLASIYTGEAMHYSGQMWDAVNVLNQKYGKLAGSEELARLSKADTRKKKSGKAKANGGIANGETRALVGELGQELVVNPYTSQYYTVGDNGAEFVSLPKNAIVFNHLQTRQLLNGNHTGSRGNALASGNAYIDSSGGNNGILGALPTTLTPSDKSSKTASAAKSAGKEISKAAKEAADDWITAFKNAAEKLRDNYTSGKMDAEQYFDALTKLYQQYYEGYGRKSDENLKKLKDAWTAIYNTEASDLDTKRSNGEITERQYLDGLRNLYKRFYGDLNVYAKEHADAQRDFAQKAKSAYQNVLQAGSSVVSHQIKQLQNQMNGAVNALQAQKDAADRSFEMQLRPLNAEIKHYEKLQKALNKQIKAKTKEQNAIEKVISAKNKEISAIQEAAQARQTDLDLQKAQYELARAEHQRTQYTYTSDKGFVYRSNPTSIKDARENLKEKTENSRVQQINNEINALTKEKEAIQDEIDKIQEVIDGYSEKIDLIQEQIDAIQELKDATDQYYDDAIYNIQQQYQSQIDALQKIQDMWDQASDMFDFATSLQLLESFGLSLSDVTSNAGASIDLVKGKLADVLAYMYQNNDAAKEVWSTILGIDLSQITPNIDNFALGIKDVSDYAGMASGSMRGLNSDLTAAQMSSMMAQGGLMGAANAATQLGTAASTTSPQMLANTMAQLSATDMTGFNSAIGSLAANAASLDTLNASLTQTLTIMQGLGAQDTFGDLYNQFVAFVTNFEALANQFQQDMTVLFGQGQAAGNDKNSQSAGWFDGFVQQVEDMNERTSAALQNQIEQWTNFQQLMVGVLGVDGNGGGDKGGEGGQGQQSGDGGSTAPSGSASADSIIGSLILAATEMNEAFMKWEETLNEFIVGEGGFTDFTNQVMEMITNMANTIKEQCEAAISAINEMVEAVASANAALASMSFSVGSSGASHPAHAAGAPTGLKHDEHHALVGELGPETVVSGDKYRVVGKHGAELVNLKRGDIVLNHQQTAKLFKSGAAHASGIGNLIPAGQPAFMNKLANISSDLLSANMKQLTPRLFTGVNVKLAAADGGGTSVTIKDLHVSLPNFNSDKADDLIRDLSSMTLKAVQKYNRH